ncbi:serine protease 1-like [Lycorma delicatula]|uniref:serine protease 1-like n=1 Tax=Lycorma delicatula TaxID=130591 RepID=UPI003F518834
MSTSTKLKQAGSWNRRFTCTVIGEWLNNNENYRRIIGGDIAKAGQFPYFVSIKSLMKLKNYRYERHICGGSILNKDVILTAGHCCFLYEFKHGVIFIAAGIINLKDKNPKEIYLEKCITHPDFKNTSHDNDIALLFLKQSIDFKKWYDVRSVSYASKPIEKDQNGTIMGFGAIDKLGDVYPDVLRTLNQTVRNPYICEKIFEPYNPVTTFCAGEVSGKSACPGDSGSPFVSGGEIYGVASYTLRECGSGPTAYTNVPHYDDWIKKTITTRGGNSSLYFTLYQTIFGNNFAKQLQSIPVSNDTAARPISDIAEDV